MIEKIVIIESVIISFKNTGAKLHLNSNSDRENVIIQSVFINCKNTGAIKL